jgi:type IV secretion system protein TrbL
MICGIPSNKSKWMLPCAILVATLLISKSAIAQNVIDQVMTQYQTAAQAWITPLRNYAIQLFWTLAGIQFCWAMGQLAFRGADLTEFLSELVTQIMFIGIFFFFVQNSDTIANDIIISASGTAGSNPTQILYDGINMGGKVIALMKWNSPGADIFYTGATFFVVGIMAYIAAIAVMVNIEAYIIVSATTLFTGFGGSRWTKEYAMRALTYAIAIGGKLFMLNLVVGIGGQIIKQQSATFSGGDYNTVMVLIGTIVVLAAVAKEA